MTFFLKTTKKKKELHYPSITLLHLYLLPLLGFPISLSHMGIDFSPNGAQKNPIRCSDSGFVLLPLQMKDAVESNNFLLINKQS